MYEMTIFDEPDKDGHRYRFALIDISAVVSDVGNPEAYEWAVERFGECNGITLQGSRWMTNPIATHVWFRDEADALDFRIRWC